MRLTRTAVHVDQPNNTRANRANRLNDELLNEIINCIYRDRGEPREFGSSPLLIRASCSSTRRRHDCRVASLLRCVRNPPSAPIAHVNCVREDTRGSRASEISCDGSYTTIESRARARVVAHLDARVATRRNLHTLRVSSGHGAHLYPADIKQTRDLFRAHEDLFSPTSL